MFREALESDIRRLAKNPNSKTLRLCVRLRRYAKRRGLATRTGLGEALRAGLCVRFSASLRDIASNKSGLTQTTGLADSGTESLCGASFRFGGLFFSSLRRCVGFERTEQTSRDTGDFIDCSQERSFVCFGRFVKAADFSYELERSSPNLLGSDGRIEVEKGFDIPAHSVAEISRKDA